MAGPVRQPIDIPSLEAFINRHVPEIKTPLSVKQFGFGQSNPTYLLSTLPPDSRNYVLRKKPPGGLLSPTAHQVEREYLIISSLAPTDVPVPHTYTLCTDLSILGTSFYIMSFLDGRIFEDPSLPLVDPFSRTTMWQSAIRTLAHLHRVPPSSVNLQRYGPPAHFYNRQIKTFRAISTSQASTRDLDTDVAVGSLPHFDDMLAFFSDPATQPKDRATLIHGDYKIDNLVFDKQGSEVIGILDWEMSTIGHPLSDLSNLLMPFLTSSSSSPSLSASPPTSAPRPTPAFALGATEGLPTRASLLALYATEAGYTPEKHEVLWADAFAMFRLSVIMQGIAARYARRQASSATARENGEMRGGFAIAAWAIIRMIQQGGVAPELQKARL